MQLLESIIDLCNFLYWTWQTIIVKIKRSFGEYEAAISLYSWFNPRTTNPFISPLNYKPG